MDETVSRLLAWMRTTDIVELAYRKGSRGVELRLSGEGSIAVPESGLVPVGSPGVGVFRFAEPGRPRLAEGAAIKPGTALGFVEAGGKKQPVLSPVKGLLSKVLCEDGRPVQYAQPLFLVEPR